MNPVHERFDLQRWVREFNLTDTVTRARAWAGQVAVSPPQEPEEPDFGRIIPTMIDGPRGLAGMEQIRAGMGDLGKAEPADVFVWAMGEPANPAQTKMGGVPYRPADAPWPRRPDGSPMTFLAQVCLADSRDLVAVPGGLLRKPRPLPGDCLLIFVPGEYLVDWDDDAPESVVFEWQSMGIPRLCQARDVPTTPSSLTPIHAQVHRTADYPRPPDGHPIYSLYSGKEVCILRGTKIGGVPAWAQSPARLPGKPLCTLGSVNPFGERFPLLGAPTAVNSQLSGKFLMLADLGMLYLSIDAKGRVHWTVQFG